MTVHLLRIDTARNLYRFYRLDVQIDLFGGVSLIREWGRMGQGGTVRMATYSTEALAQAELARAVTAKQRRGYSVILGPHVVMQRADVSAAAMARR